LRSLVLLLFLASFLRRLLDDASSTSESDDEAAGPVRRLASTLLLDEAGFPLFMCECRERRLKMLSSNLHSPCKRGVAC
jgi:hypothetical protein